jgi:hypothetical protein
MLVIASTPLGAYSLHYRLHDLLTFKAKKSLNTVMDKEVMISDRDLSRRKRKKTFLYARIMIWLSIPLFILGAIFTAIQLTNQLQTLNQLYRLRSEFAFKTIQDTLRRF